MENRMTQDSRSMMVNQIFISILGRQATPREMSFNRLLGSDAIKDVATTILYEDSSKCNELKIMNFAAKSKKKNGVTIVGPYNKKCGISTYIENLYFHLRKSFSVNIASEDTRNREDNSYEDGVEKCWNCHSDDLNLKIIEQAAKFGNKVVHIQHEFGIFRNNNLLGKLISDLKRCGFRVAITLHTVLSESIFDRYYSHADVIIVHSESAASRLYGKGINNVTVIPHGTYEPIQVGSIESIEFVEQFIRLDPGDILGCSIGFITKDKLQEETLRAVKISQEKVKNLKFLLIGSTGRREYDLEYFPILKSMENDSIKIVNKYLSNKEVAMVLTACDFSIMNYHQTHHSVSGSSHLLMAYGVPSISSESRILQDLDSSMSIKVDGYKIEDISKSIIEMCENEDKRFKMGDSALSRGIQTSWESSCKSHMKVYNSIGEFNAN